MFQMSQRIAIFGFAALSAISMFPTTVFGQTANFPVKPIHFVVPAQAGGGFDQFARVVADKLTKTLEVPVVVDNKPGAGHVLATSAVAAANADGYTLLVAGGNHTLNPFFQDKLPYDSVKDFEPVIMMGKTPFVMVVTKALPVTNLNEFIAYAKANPKVLNFTATQPNGAAQLAGELLKLNAGIGMEFISFKGSAGALTDVLAGRIQVMFDAPVTSLPHIEKGALRPLAVTSRIRSASLPQVPTMAELGQQGFDITAWIGLLAPAKTPASVVAKLNAAVTTALNDPEVRAKLVASAWSVEPSSPTDMRQFMANEVKTWADLIARSKLSTK